MTRLLAMSDEERDYKGVKGFIAHYLFIFISIIWIILCCGLSILLSFVIAYAIAQSNDEGPPPTPTYKSIEVNCPFYTKESANKDEVSTELELKNVALNKPASQSSEYKDKARFPASNAVDGNSAQNSDSGSCIHTSVGNLTELTPWWRVDLEQLYRVVKVDLYDRNDATFRSRDYQVRVGSFEEQSVSSSIFNLNTLCDEHIGRENVPKDYVYHFVCKHFVVGRYVSVQKIALCADCPESDYNILSFCEVEVFGYPEK